MTRGIDPRVAASVSRLKDDLGRVAGRQLSGVYIHGSAVLGDFIAGVSDLDVVVVTHDDVDAGAIRVISATLAAHDPGPAVGVEASVVTRSAARAPRAPWPYLVHVTNHPDDHKVVFGHDRDGDPDLALHYAVIRQHGWTAVGPPAADCFGEIDRATIVARLADELAWAAGNAPGSYAVLNACRALRFVSDGVLCSKTEGGRWALSNRIEPDLVSAALTARGGGPGGASPTRGRAPSVQDRAWVLSVARSLDRGDD